MCCKVLDFRLDNMLWSVHNATKRHQSGQHPQARSTCDAHAIAFFYARRRRTASRAHVPIANVWSLLEALHLSAQPSGLSHTAVLILEASLLLRNWAARCMLRDWGWETNVLALIMVNILSTKWAFPIIFIEFWANLVGSRKRADIAVSICATHSLG